MWRTHIDRPSEDEPPREAFAPVIRPPPCFLVRERSGLDAWLSGDVDYRRRADTINKRIAIVGMSPVRGLAMLMRIS